MPPFIPPYCQFHSKLPTTTPERGLLLLLRHFGAGGDRFKLGVGLCWEEAGCCACCRPFPSGRRRRREEETVEGNGRRRETGVSPGSLHFPSPSFLTPSYLPGGGWLPHTCRPCPPSMDWEEHSSLPQTHGEACLPANILPRERKQDWALPRRAERRRFPDGGEEALCHTWNGRESLLARALPMGTGGCLPLRLPTSHAFLETCLPQPGGGAAGGHGLWPEA